MVVPSKLRPSLGSEKGKDGWEKRSCRPGRANSLANEGREMS